MRWLVRICWISSENTTENCNYCIVKRPLTSLLFTQKHSSPCFSSRAAAAATSPDENAMNSFNFLIALEQKQNYMSAAAIQARCWQVKRVKPEAEREPKQQRDGDNMKKKHNSNKRDKIKIFYHVHRGIAQYCLLEIIINFLIFFSLLLRLRERKANQRNSMALNFERRNVRESRGDNGIPDRFFIEPNGQQKWGSGRKKKQAEREWGRATW